MRILLNLILGGVLVAYPFLIYWGLTQFEPRFLALILAGLFLIRGLVMGSLGKAHFKTLLPLAAAVLTTVILVLVFGKSEYLFLNPVFMNLVFLGTFAYTLKKPPPMIERFARMRQAELPPEAIPYCRKVTWVWCGFFVFNGSIAFWTAFFASPKIWTLYNGFISYVLMGLLFAAEWVVRQWHMRYHAAKHGKELAP